MARGRDVIRTLAAWRTEALPVTSLYLDVDGRRRPVRSVVVARADDLLRRATGATEDAGRDSYRSVCRDAERIRRLVRDHLDRRGVRGLAVFSCSGAGLWESVELAQPVPDRVSVAPRPDLVPLEAVLETAETFCTVLVDREKARILVTTLGEVEEVTSILDEVPGRHDQGGWAQARLQRHVEDHVLRHLRHVGDALLRLHQRRGFDHLVIAGPDEAVAELERGLHSYVRRTLLTRISLPITASAGEVAEHAVALERDLEAGRERRAVDRLVSETRGATGRTVAGVRETLGALEAGRVETLVVSAGLEVAGVRCAWCGHLDVAGPRCALCGRETEEAPLVEEAVESALRQRCRVETVTDAGGLASIGGIGALLRF